MTGNGRKVGSPFAIYPACRERWLVEYRATGGRKVGQLIGLLQIIRSVFSFAFNIYKLYTQRQNLRSFTLGAAWTYCRPRSPPRGSSALPTPFSPSTALCLASMTKLFRLSFKIQMPYIHYAAHYRGPKYWALGPDNNRGNIHLIFTERPPPPTLM